MTKIPCKELLDAIDLENSDFFAVCRQLKSAKKEMHDTEDRELNKDIDNALRLRFGLADEPDTVQYRVCNEILREWQKAYSNE